jgi:hypothetical protein
MDSSDSGGERGPDGSPRRGEPKSDARLSALVEVPMWIAFRRIRARMPSSIRWSVMPTEFPSDKSIHTGVSGPVMTNRTIGMWPAAFGYISNEDNY